MRIEDVRPLFATFHWAFHAVSGISQDLEPTQARILQGALGDAVQFLALRFRGLEFYDAWVERHHRPFSFDAACLAELILCALSLPKELPVAWAARQIERILASRNPRTVTRKGAIHEDLRSVGDRELRFVVYGHTHAPERVPLRGSAEVQDVYLNTGTYRPGVFRADDGEGFVGWQRIAYAVVSSRDESLGDSGPAFVAWSGALSRGSASRAGFSRIR
jgi:hypothetical protein